MEITADEAVPRQTGKGKNETETRPKNQTKLSFRFVKKHDPIDSSATIN